MITVNWADLNKWTSVGPWSETTSATVRDLWAKADVATDKSGSYGVMVPSHGLAMLKLTPAPVVFLRPDRVSKSLGGIHIASSRLRVDLAGSHSLQILDLDGRVVWRRNGTGPAQYRPSVPGDGSHILRVLTAESRGNLRY
jgi:hypothetical protein